MGNNIPIDQMLIWRITRLPYQGWKLVEEFTGKDHDRTVAENMKKKYSLVKGNRGYDIKLIRNQVVCFIAYILARKIMRKCCANEVPTLAVSLAA